MLVPRGWRELLFYSKPPGAKQVRLLLCHAWSPLMLSAQGKLVENVEVLQQAACKTDLYIWAKKQLVKKCCPFSN